MPAETIAQTFGVDGPHLIAQVISFSIVCALLYWLAYTPVLRMLAARREQIAQGLANTRKIDAALAAIDAQREEILRAAQVDAVRIVDEAHEAARGTGEQERQRARVTAERIVSAAHDQAAREHIRMRADLRREVGHLVIETAAAVTGRVLTADDQRRLVDETTRTMKAA
jgi:F-type H+-transporting ATPase subunit b